MCIWDTPSSYLSKGWLIQTLYQFKAEMGCSRDVLTKSLTECPLHQGPCLSTTKLTISWGTNGSSPI